MSSTAKKITSPGSQFSVSDPPTAPNPTPFNEGAPIGFIPPIDFSALANHLADNQDQLNEAANEAMYPSPPINTPEVLSPVPSIVFRMQTHSRGINSGLGDRLAQVQMEIRRFHHRAADMTSSSRSIGHSLAEEDEECDCCASEVMSDCDKDGVDPGPGSSPTVNPRIEEYLSFSAASVPDNGAPAAVHVVHVSPSSKTDIDSDNVNSANGPDISKSLGVTERNNWAEEVEEYVDGALLRLEQLATDEYITDPSNSIEEYYVARLKRVLASRKRTIPIHIPEPMASKYEETAKYEEAVKFEEAVKKGEVEKGMRFRHTRPSVF